MGRSTKGAVAATLLLLACVGCGSSLGPNEGLPEELVRARQRWVETRPNAYAYAVERICFCAPSSRGPVRVTVVAGTVTERVYVDGGDAVPEEARDAFPTVDGLFDVVADALRRGAAQIDVEYDETTGVPTSIFIDYLEMAADDELGFAVREPVTPIAE